VCPSEPTGSAEGAQQVQHARHNWEALAGGLRHALSVRSLTVAAPELKGYWKRHGIDLERLWPADQEHMPAWANSGSRFVERAAGGSDANDDTVVAPKAQQKGSLKPTAAGKKQGGKAPGGAATPTSTTKHQPAQRHEEIVVKEEDEEEDDDEDPSGSWDEALGQVCPCVSLVNQAFSA
jgi:hypothetical protein